MKFSVGKAFAVGLLALGIVSFLFPIVTLLICCVMALVAYQYHAVIDMQLKMKEDLDNVVKALEVSEPVKKEENGRVI